MPLLVEAEPAAPATPCACCRAPATSRVWAYDVCGDCAAAWFDASPTVGDIDAKAAPDDIAWVDELPGGRRLMGLKPGVLEREMSAAAARWVAERRKLAVAA